MTQLLANPDQQEGGAPKHPSVAMIRRLIIAETEVIRARDPVLGAYLDQAPPNLNRSDKRVYHSPIAAPLLPGWRGRVQSIIRPIRILLFRIKPLRPLVRRSQTIFGNILTRGWTFRR